ncbi:IS66-like element accessory protein TnpA [Paraburkholderia kururiensis]|uniref:IS66-like element accessory protein TnpA n=1 Tax=Paraburkholderia kururiensis TaxID=984307 RepID=UPI000A5A292B|nr:transposase [Paraburkholderia kururiensis]
MDNSDDVVQAAPKRPNFSDEYRRAIVEMTMQPGASVSRIAREHGLNDNMVFKWRQRFKREFATKTSVPAPVPGITGSTPLLPVSVIDAPSSPAKERSATTAGCCEVEIEVGKRRVRIRGVSLEFAERFLRDCLK